MDMTEPPMLPEAQERIIDHLLNYLSPDNAEVMRSLGCAALAIEDETGDWARRPMMALLLDLRTECRLQIKSQEKMTEMLQVLPGKQGIHHKQPSTR